MRSRTISALTGGTFVAQSACMPRRAYHPEPPSPTRKVPVTIDGISEAAVVEFCDALVFADKNHEPTKAEKEKLKRALVRVSHDAHAAGVTAERMLIGLKRAWWKVCGRHPSPDVFDPLWDAVVHQAVEAYESVRPATTMNPPRN